MRSLMSWIWKLGLGLALGYAVVVLVGFTLQRSMMYFPGPALPTPSQAGAPNMQVVQLLTDDGLRLESWYSRAQGDAATIVYFHGNAGTLTNRIAKTRRFVADGYGLLLVGYRGYGGNDGSPSEEGLFADAEAAYRFLVETEAIAPERIAVLGESLGTGVAVWLAARKTVGAVLLEAPYTSIADVAALRASIFLPTRALVRDRFDSLARVAAIEAPVLIVHGEQDAVIPIGMARRLFAAARQPKEAHFLPDAGHNDLGDFGLVALEAAFLRRYLPGR